LLSYAVRLAPLIRSLPGRAAVVVDLDKQGFNEGEIQLPDSVQARMDRSGVGRLLLRKSIVVSSGVDNIEPFTEWWVHPDEGQWWNSNEIKDTFGVDVPKNIQLRLYGVHTSIYGQILFSYR